MRLITSANTLRTESDSFDTADLQASRELLNTTTEKGPGPKLPDKIATTRNQLLNFWKSWVGASRAITSLNSEDINRVERVIGEYWAVKTVGLLLALKEWHDETDQILDYYEGLYRDPKCGIPSVEKFIWASPDL